MGALFRLINNVARPAAGTRIISAAETGLLLEANDILAAAVRRAREVEENAKLAYEEQRLKGYEDGQEACRGEYAEKVLEVALQSVEYIEGLEQTIVKVVTEAVERVIGELDDNERIVRIVRTALSAVRNQKRVVARVAPADEKAVTDGLAAMISRGHGASGFLDVVADPRLPTGSCILESELGVVDAGLETQMHALEKAFNAKIKGS
ncbi:MAG: HrpE/YscL family type III secretion apparatus protein [Desulfovibrio sp.]|jgi:type III secretion protein L|nr:HrpE/YscL family type III secretion apparatus protein [Desulfovibrio sp.]